VSGGELMRVLYCIYSEDIFKSWRFNNYEHHVLKRKVSTTAWTIASSIKYSMQGRMPCRPGHHTSFECRLVGQVKLIH